MMRWLVIAAGGLLLFVVVFGGVAFLRIEQARQQARMGKSIIPSTAPNAIASTLVGHPVTGEPAKLTPIDDPVPAAPGLVNQILTGDTLVRSHAADELINCPTSVLPTVRAAANRADVKNTLAEIQLKRVLEVQEPRAAREKYRRAEQDAMRRATLQAYDQFGHHDPKWDDSARQALTLFIQSRAEAHRSPDDDAKIADLFSQAIKAGCDDPLVLSFHRRMISEFGLPSEEGATTAAASEAANRYPAAWQPIVLGWHESPHANGAAVEVSLEVHPDSDRTALEALIHCGDFTPDQKYHWAKAYLERCHAQAVDPQTGTVRTDLTPQVDDVCGLLSQVLPGQPQALMLKGEFYVNCAWDRAIADGPGNSETSRVVLGRLRIASRALSQAYQMDPTDPRASTPMVRVRFGMDTETMDKWFARAMKADPDNYEACAAKMHYLEPHWYGGQSPKLMFDFARDCRDKANYRGRIPLILADAHVTLSQYMKNPGQYLQKPDVWSDIHGVYEQYLTLFPRARRERTQYAVLCVFAGQREDARRQFDILGDKPWPGVFEAWGMNYQEAQHRH